MLAAVSIAMDCDHIPTYTKMPEPTPTPDWEQLNTNYGQAGPYTGPVPVEIQTATGYSTWAEIAQMGEQQLQLAAAAGADSVTTTFERGTPVRVTLSVDEPGPTETPTP